MSVKKKKYEFIDQFRQAVNSLIAAMEFYCRRNDGSMAEFDHAAALKTAMREFTDCHAVLRADLRVAVRHLADLEGPEARPRTVVDKTFMVNSITERLWGQYSRQIKAT